MKIIGMVRQFDLSLPVQFNKDERRIQPKIHSLQSWAEMNRKVQLDWTSRTNLNV